MNESKIEIMKEFWKVNRMGYLISTVISIFGGMFIHLVISSRNDVPINIISHLSWSLIFTPVFVFVLMCLVGGNL